MPAHNCLTITTWKLYLVIIMHLSMLSRWEGGRPGIGGGFDSGHRPVVGTFDRFNGLSSNILLTFSCYFDNPQMPWGGAFEQKLSAQFKCPTYARPPLPQQLNIDRCITCEREIAPRSRETRKWACSDLWKFFLSTPETAEKISQKNITNSQYDQGPVSRKTR